MQAGKRKALVKKIFSLSSPKDFGKAALEIFSYQSANNKIYKKYLNLLGKDPERIARISEIPFLPVSMFKTHKVLTAVESGKIAFKSSGTGGSVPAIHHVADPGLYKSSFLKCFELFYGNPGNFCILALLPSYLERGDSSLVYMVRELIEKSSHPKSGFYPGEPGRLAETIEELEAGNEKILLLGVSFALLDLVEKKKFTLKNTIVMETGGMKGRRKEMIREELHSILRSGFGVHDIHSEYGMTELLSQAYSGSGGKFLSPPWMKVMIRDPYDPFSYLEEGRNGGVNIIDLSNIDSCAFLETSDLGKILPGGEFEILGRFDNSDIRGCNLLAG
jgi:phenylacetate-coenzyme A ligase PaaK-like adenylate-forming protein